MLHSKQKDSVDLSAMRHVVSMILDVHSLHYSVSTSNSELHRLLLDCNETEQAIITRMAK